MEIITNAREVARCFDIINAQLELGRATLFQELGESLSEKVKRRIETQDDGQWAPLSKWIKAKKSPERALQGAEEFIKFRFDEAELSVYGEMPADWTLTQHDEGFDNKEDHKVGEAIVIEIVDPSPLGLASVPNGIFSWVPKGTPGHTPARRIWLDEEEVVVIVEPIAERWMQATVATAIAESGVEATVIT